MVKIILIFTLSLLITSAHAAYQRTGPIMAQVCRGFIIEACSSVQVDAVSEDGTQFYEPIETFDTVDEYNEQGKLCHVRPRRGWWHWVAGFVFNTTRFYRKSDADGFERIYPEYVSFNCAPLTR
jgi:hypothetical protein